MKVARQLFHIAGIPFEDYRIPMSEWEAFKASKKHCLNSINEEL